MSSVTVKVKKKVSVSATITKPTASTIDTDFEADKLTPEVGETVQFTDKSSLSPTRWLWSLDDGNYSEQQNPSISYSSKGKKTIRLHAGGTGTAAADAGNVAEKVDYIDVQKASFIANAFIATTGDVLNDSLNSASAGDSVEVVRGEEEPTLDRDASQTTSAAQPQAVDVNGVLALKGDGNDDFMFFDNLGASDWEGLVAKGTFAVTFMSKPDADTSGELGFGVYNGGTDEIRLGNSDGRGGVQIIIFNDSNGNTKEYQGTSDRRGQITVTTYVLRETGDFEIIVNGTDEATQATDQSPDFSALSLPVDSIHYLKEKGNNTYTDYPQSKEVFVHDANSVSQGHHMDAHNFLRNLFNV